MSETRQELAIRHLRTENEELQRKLNLAYGGDKIVRCHRGHETPHALWNCPVCTDHHVEENIALRQRVEELEAERDKLREEVAARKGGTHRFTPQPTDKDFCDLCGSYFTHPIHERAAQPDEEEK